MAAPVRRVAEPELKVRRLEAGDFDKGFVQLLGQLTTVGEVTRAQFEAQLARMRACPGTYHTVVVEDVQEGRVIAVATVLMELKIIHGCSKVGHIEDVVVDKTYRGLGLGFKVVDECSRIARAEGAYKVILNCAEKNVAFYEKVGFTRKSAEMVMYFDDDGK